MREQIAALSDIMRIVSLSRDDEAPVFEAVLRYVVELCSASATDLFLGQSGDAHLRLAASHHADTLQGRDTETWTARVNSVPVKMDAGGNSAARAICTGHVVNIADLAETEGDTSDETLLRIMVEARGFRASLSVPLIGSDGAIGAICLHRKEPGRFREDQIDLVRSFAVQATIAAETAELCAKATQALEQQRTTSGILRAIRFVCRCIHRTPENKSTHCGMMFQPRARACRKRLALRRMAGVAWRESLG